MRARSGGVEHRRGGGGWPAPRRSQVGTGERAEKVRTYNFPQDRVTDHRVGFTRHSLPALLDGDIDDIIDALRDDEQARLMEAQLA